jgi:hypothetical protein
LALLALPPRL